MALLAMFFASGAMMSGGARAAAHGPVMAPVTVMAPDHCDMARQGGERSLPGPSPHCMIACAAIPSCAPQPVRERAEALVRYHFPPSMAVDGLAAEAETPPPRRV